MGNAPISTKWPTVLRLPFGALLLVFAAPTALAQWSPDYDPCVSLPEGRPGEHPVYGPHISYTPEEFEKLRRCRQYRLDQLQRVLDTAGINCRSLDLMLGDCSIDILTESSIEPLAREADVRLHIDFADALVDILEAHSRVE